MTDDDTPDDKITPFPNHVERMLRAFHKEAAPRVEQMHKSGEALMNHVADALGIKSVNYSVLAPLVSRLLATGTVDGRLTTFARIVRIAEVYEHAIECVRGELSPGRKAWREFVARSGECQFYLAIEENDDLHFADTLDDLHRHFETPEDEREAVNEATNLILATSGLAHRSSWNRNEAFGHVLDAICLSLKATDAADNGA